MNQPLRYWEVQIIGSTKCRRQISHYIGGYSSGGGGSRNGLGGVSHHTNISTHIGLGICCNGVAKHASIHHNPGHDTNVHCLKEVFPAST